MPSANPLTQAMIDISVPIFPEMPIYPGDPAVVFETVMDMAQGGPANVTCLHLGSHTGTHYDTPHHILNNGKTMDHVPLSRCYGPTYVAQVPDEIQAITAEVLASLDLPPCTRLLLKTRNSRYWQESPTEFRSDYAGLTGDGAAFVVAQGIELVGIDYLSIELFDSPNLEAHKTLLHHDVLILEGLNLTQVTPGFYTLSALPLAYQAMDGAPTRAALIPLS